MGDVPPSSPIKEPGARPGPGERRLPIYFSRFADIPRIRFQIDKLEPDPDSKL
jgi:hypothetical protein